MRVIRRFQEGGPVEQAPQEAPMEQSAPEQGGDPIEQVAQVAAQALQNQDCEAAMAVCQAFLQLVQGGGQEAPAEEPTYARNGARLVRIR